MSETPSSSSFIDGKFLITMVLVLGCWLGWQAYMAKKYPQHYQSAEKKTAGASAPAAETAAGDTSGEASNKPDAEQHAGSVGAPEASQQNVQKNVEELLSYEDDMWSFDVSSYGMALKNVHLKKYTDREGKAISFASEPGLALFGSSMVGRRDPIEFTIKKTADLEYVGTAQIDGMKITKILHIDSNNYTVETKLRAENLSDSFTGFVTQFNEKIQPHKGGGFLMPSFEHQEFYVNYDGTDTRTAVVPDQPLVESFIQTKIAAFGSQYFAVAVLDKSPVMAEFKASTLSGENAIATGAITHSLLNKSNQFAVEYVSFAGPKSYEVLKTIDADMTKIVNLGFFNSIAKAVLWLMRTIHAAIGNWGIAIIFLTIIVRIIVLPFNLIGYKQMKAMAKIQPAMKALREKYKSEPQKLNQEMLVLMKDAKANPLGGCLPMFLQIPIFFALYQVIGQSIDLYQAPFMLWIHDLSLKDPYYVLPALMGITMFIQQKITPNTMEPAQQKVMMFMPIFFTFLMVSLPSGLTLYIFVSSVFGVVQQLYFMRDNNPVTVRA
ncbi:MAG: membrane protein insertase YidC [Bdellovibrionales bacterium]|nr:membrane protein insertase YidC [Bdellovibrionales bacterium]